MISTGQLCRAESNETKFYISRHSLIINKSTLYCSKYVVQRIMEKLFIIVGPYVICRSKWQFVLKQMWDFSELEITHFVPVINCGVLFDQCRPASLYIDIYYYLFNRITLYWMSEISCHSLIFSVIAKQIFK